MKKWQIHATWLNEKEKKHHHNSNVSDFDANSSKPPYKDLQKPFEKLNYEALTAFKKLSNKKN
jgi:hypothetical protein